MIFKRRKNGGDPAAAAKPRRLAGKPAWVKAALGAAAALLVLQIGLAVHWSGEPDIFWVNERPDNERTVVGYATTDTLVRVAQTMLDKPGGYLTNDIMPPGVFLDNIPNWEFGVRQQVRDLAAVIRNDYSRSQSQSREDPDVAVAQPKFSFSNDSWILPRTESEYRDAIAGFARYRDRLSGIGGSDAQFYARADNLREWLAQVEKRLGSLTRRLGDSVANTVINTDLAGERAASATSGLTDSVEVRTPWYEIDDIFFEARGTSWALVHFFRAAEFDFEHVLSDKNAAVINLRELLDQG